MYRAIMEMLEWHNWCNVMPSQPRDAFTPLCFALSVHHLCSSWGRIVSPWVLHASGGGHVFNVENQRGRIVYVEA